MESYAALNELRSHWKKNASEEDLLLARLLQLKFRLEDYLKKDAYDHQMRFSYFLKLYMEILGKKSVDFAKEVCTHKTLISQYINNTRLPNDAFLVRLEIHSNNLIPAEHWLQLTQKDKIHELKINSSLRKVEKKHVTKRIPVGIGRASKGAALLDV